MKVLLDENLPHQLRLELKGHEVLTVAYMAWSGLQNRKRLNEAATSGFDVLITTDRGLAYQQNLATLPLAVIVLIAKTNTIEAIRPLFVRAQAELTNLKPRSFVTRNDFALVANRPLTRRPYSPARAPAAPPSPRRRSCCR